LLYWRLDENICVYFCTVADLRGRRGADFSRR
jgi:hypothetical protein